VFRRQRYGRHGCARRRLRDTAVATLLPLPSQRRAARRERPGATGGRARPRRGPPPTGEASERAAAVYLRAPLEAHLTDVDCSRRELSAGRSTAHAERQLLRNRRVRKQLAESAAARPCAPHVEHKRCARLTSIPRRYRRRLALDSCRSASNSRTRPSLRVGGLRVGGRPEATDRG
jgi:hypothetical protein